MNIPSHAGLCIGLALALVAGCAKPRPPAPPPPTVREASPAGLWESSLKEGQTMKMNFAADGKLTFEGGMQFYNPGHWSYDRTRQELVLHLPQASDEKLQVFKLSVGEGVKALDREGKRVTYDFGLDTSELNVAGWIFTRGGRAESQRPAPMAPEPVLK